MLIRMVEQREGQHGKVRVGVVDVYEGLWLRDGKCDAEDSWGLERVCVVGGDSRREECIACMRAVICMRSVASVIVKEVCHARDE